MLGLDFQRPSNTRLKVLGLGAHSDDLEIGCGGLILHLVKQRRVEFDWVVFSAAAARAREARRSAALFLRGAAGHRVATHGFRDGFFPYDGGEIKKVFEALKDQVRPDLILTHYRDDRHQDHRLLSELTWNTFRNHLILEYEIPKFDGDLGAPNCFVPLKRSACLRKVKYLNTVFATQRDKHWFSEETFMALMRLRGMECRAADGYAEAFYVRKLVIAT
jgi:LmbE family N-acetylglucosaminyl deacetylase